jgi:hypothetical protein
MGAPVALWLLRECSLSVPIATDTRSRAKYRRYDETLGNAAAARRFDVRALLTPPLAASPPAMKRIFARSRCRERPAPARARKPGRSPSRRTRLSPSSSARPRSICSSTRPAATSPRSRASGCSHRPGSGCYLRDRQQRCPAAGACRERVLPSGPTATVPGCRRL